MSYTSLTVGWTVTAGAGPVPEEIKGIAVPATVPGCVHTDLVDAGLIADPFDGDNEAAQQWIGSTDWRYSTTFEWHDDGELRHDLVAEGLDTLATVTLNGHEVARTRNQFRSYRFEVGQWLREGTNRLEVLFDAPVTAAERLLEEHGDLPHVNHHPYNMLRKMAANFGWDWGIDVATSGIWRPIGLEGWSGARIVSVRPLVDVRDGVGILTAHIDIEHAGATGPLEAVVQVGEQRVTATVPAGARAATIQVDVPDVRLWWPVGHGDQPLYPVTVELAGRRWESRVGFRTVTLDTAPDEAGSPFRLLVNGCDVEVHGANWIPDHAFVTRIDRDRYAARIQDALDANMNLLRVWGGGLYESEDFYELCDEAGLLVWQDFLFACAAYAEEEWLRPEVEAEAREAVTRLVKHPSLVIWNGNNENIWGWVAWGWRARLAGRTWGNGYYRELLPAIVGELDGTRPYSPGSPYSFSEYLHPNDEQNGTMHIWDVWNARDYTAYREHRPRFVSEFGFQGPPAYSTLMRVVHDDPIDPYGPDMLVHQKAGGGGGNAKLEKGMAGHLRSPVSVDEWHWATQLNQAHALRFGIEHFRSLSPHCTGTIVWQLNDNWPVISWAAVDFDGHRKPLWYAIREAYRPRLITIQPREDGLAAVLVNDTDEEWTGRLTVRRMTFDGQSLAGEELVATVSARSATTVALPTAVTVAADPAAEVLAVETGDPRFGRALWNFSETVDQRLDPDAAQVTVVAAEPGVLGVTVHARSYLRDIVLQVDRVDPAATVDHGMVTLLAGESAVFRVSTHAPDAPEQLVSAPVLSSANTLGAVVAADA